MAFIKQIIQDRVVQMPHRYKDITTMQVFDFEPQPGVVTAEGTVINAALLQRYENTLEAHENTLSSILAGTTKVPKATTADSATTAATATSATSASSAAFATDADTLDGKHAIDFLLKTATAAAAIKLANARKINGVAFDGTVDIAIAAANPAVLTFTGGVSAAYDGSAAKSIAIPVIPSSLPANGGNADTTDGLHLWFGAEGSRGSDASFVYFCY